MATVIAFVWLKRSGSQSGFQITRKNLEFARLPSVGEFVNLGNDTEGVSADYRVAVVVHAPLRPNGIDAEIYLERVFLPHELHTVSERIGANPNDQAHLLPARDGE